MGRGVVSCPLVSACAHIRVSFQLSLRSATRITLPAQMGTPSCTRELWGASQMGATVATFEARTQSFAGVVGIHRRPAIQTMLVLLYIILYHTILLYAILHYTILPGSSGQVGPPQYVCMYACMYVRMYVRTHARMYICMYMYVYNAIYTYIYIYTHTHSHIYIYIYIISYIHISIYMYICIYIYMYMNMCVCIYIYIYIYI